MIGFNQNYVDDTCISDTNKRSIAIAAYEKANEASADRGAHIDQCENNKTVSDDKFCFFDIKKVDNNCTKGQEFGYKRGDPCVLIKLNRVMTK